MKYVYALFIFVNSIPAFSQNIYTISRDTEPVYVFANRIFLQIGQAFLIIVPLCVLFFFLWRKHCLNKNNHVNLKVTTVSGIEKEIERGIELLRLCQNLQTQRDGIDRPDLFVIDKSKTLDEFAQDIQRAAINLSALKKLIPMADQLSELGRALEDAGRIKVDYGDDYSQKALEFFVAEYGAK